MLLAGLPRAETSVCQALLQAGDSNGLIKWREAVDAAGFHLGDMMRGSAPSASGRRHRDISPSEVRQAVALHIFLRILSYLRL